MKKYEEIIKSHTKTFSKNHTEKNSNKTTNVNVLLNRVRLDKKKNLRKKFLISLILLSAICALIFYLSI